MKATIDILSKKIGVNSTKIFPIYKINNDSDLKLDKNQYNLNLIEEIFNCCEVFFMFARENRKNTGNITEEDDNYPEYHEFNN